MSILFTASGLNGYPGGVLSGQNSVGSGNTTRHSLSKELMQKLRSMTETIKMLSDENEMLKRENERIRDEEEGVYTVIKHEVGKVGGPQTGPKHSTTAKKISNPAIVRPSEGGYDDMNKSELVSLTKAYDQKVKALSDEILTLQRDILRQSNEQMEKEGKTEHDEDNNDKLQKNDTGASKDKYKTLARRLKEERNQYRDTCEEKQ